MAGQACSELTSEEIVRAITAYYGYPANAQVIFTTKTLPPRDGEGIVFNFPISVIDGARVAWETE